MKSGRKKLIPVFIVVLLLALCNFTLIISADELKVGSVKGLPEKLVVLDDNGQSVSENGEYFFEVEDMQAAETYSKKIQIMNLREDASYIITLRAQPLTNVGEIDLENECVCSIYIDNKIIYYGKVSGEGEPDIRDKAVSLGTYAPGESHVMTVYVRWNGTDAGGEIDNGARIVDYNGTSVVREKSGESHISGETTFKWIFYAEVKRSDADQSQGTISEITPDDSNIPGQTSDMDMSGSGQGGNQSNDPSRPHHTDPNNPIATGETIAYVAIGVIMTGTLLLAVLVFGRKKKKEKKKQK